MHFENHKNRASFKCLRQTFIDEKMFPKIRTFLFIAICSTYGIATKIDTREGVPEWEDLECEVGHKISTMTIFLHSLFREVIQ